jgi:hypothetical protein
MHFQKSALMFCSASRVKGNQYILFWKSRREKEYMCRRNRNCSVAFLSRFENLNCSLLTPKGRFSWNFWHFSQKISSWFAKILGDHININIGCIVLCTENFYIFFSFVRVALCYACYVKNSKSINLSSAVLAGTCCTTLPAISSTQCLVSEQLRIYTGRMWI